MPRLTHSVQPPSATGNNTKTSGLLGSFSGSPSDVRPAPAPAGQSLGIHMAEPKQYLEILRIA